MSDAPKEQQVQSVHAAWGELQQSLMQMSPQEAHRNFQMAQDEIKRLQQQEEEERRQQELKKKRQQTIKTTNEKKVEGSAVPAVNDKEKKNTRSGAFSLPLDDATVAAQAKTKGNHDREWIYSVDEMPNISSYQVTLWPKTKGDTLPSPHDLALSLKGSSQGNTVVTLRLQDAILFSTQFPGRLVSSPELLTNVVRQQSDCLSLRLQSRDTFHDDAFTTSDNNRTSLAAVHSICCRYCDHALLSETQEIEKVLPLPKGHWDEVTDYLICYNGQPAVDFSSASTLAQEHLALEDSAVLVLHSKSVGNAICALAVEGYGEESGETANDDEGVDSATFRGPRAWRDAVGGATLCCSQCCAVLGFASLTHPETFRLLKHRLSSGDCSQWNALHGCAAFVAHEVVRYAESKAIYTFVVSVRSEGMPNQAHRKCILLKLLSWDTRQANSKDSSSSVDNVDLLSFKRVVKVIYEVSADHDMDTGMHDSDDPMNWTWGGVDLCCLPDGTSRVQQAQMDDAGEQAEQEQRTASVRLWLSQEEWNELHHGLVESSKYFSKAVTDATILVKLGPPQTGEKRVDGSIGLSALPLLA